MKENVYIDLIRSKKFIHYFILYSSIFIFSLIISTIIGLEIAGLSDSTMYVVKKYSIFDMISVLTNNFLISIVFLYCFCEFNGDKFKEFIGKFYFLKAGIITGLSVAKVVITYNLVLALSMIVPHGIIEIPTVIYAFSGGWALSELKEKRKLKVTKELIYISAIILVLLSISAYVEIYITPRLFETLLSYYY